ncbi:MULTISPECIES: UdgX family uracil-DNA binding protein [unclassified Brevundimonas]|uniref:UdgX family uracil-DNA binding protein n=1 Tax=unclassified Brevundimonas TaxID=2622653 RepID=UPI0025BFA449|nr:MULTISPECIES: UdgX family uracil-DNA binding protein [unclassified Brevundimonas]
MRTVHLVDETDFAGWRDAARSLRLSGVEPARVRFVVGEKQAGLFSEIISEGRGEDRPFKVSKAFVDLAGEVILHRDPDRFDLLYRLLWRLQDEPDLIKVTSDRDVAWAMEMAKNVSRASHKMKAFVRFRQQGEGDNERWIAWFEPAHRVLAKTAPFFVRRYANMRWSILTPDGAAHWDLQTLSYGPPARKEDAPQEDEIEDFWKTYYASTFNPARLRTKAMKAEMPKSYWKNLPEAELIADLIAGATGRTEQMVTAPAPEPNRRFDQVRAAPVDRTVTDDVVPDTLETLNKALEGCRRCPLWRDATRPVCGAGPGRARLMIVGEQPGDHEDLTGRPFVGPAGKVLDKALSDAGIDRQLVYLTNAVKHFKHTVRERKRLHRTPAVSEIDRCRWWLDHERSLVKPDLIVAMGASAARGVTGHAVNVSERRGRIEEGAHGALLVTYHPAYILRHPDPNERQRAQAAFTADLALAATYLNLSQ